MLHVKDPDKISFKNSLKQFCQHTIEQRITAAKETIKNAQEAANSEEKSSAGDKYETSRAMGHLQKDMYSKQLTEYVKELADLHAVNTGNLCQHAMAGAFIQTATASFFIAAGIGKQIIEGKIIFFLSPHAPLANILQNKKAGDSFVFNGNTVVVTAVY